MKTKDQNNPMTPSQSGKLGKQKSPWRYGWGVPLTPADKGYYERTEKWRNEK